MSRPSPRAGHAHDLAGAQSGLTYGLSDGCGIENDVLATVASSPGFTPAVQTFSENVGANGPYVADVVKTAVPLRNWVAVTSGYDIEHLFRRYCDTDNGRLAYYYYMLNKVFGGICQITGAANRDARRDCARERPAPARDPTGIRARQT